jgi:hypothetical protein
MNFMAKTGKFPLDADVLCEKAGLFVEQAYVLLEKGSNHKEEALEILMKRSAKGEIEKCIMLSIKFDFIDEFIKKLITRANRNTNEVNILLEYIDYFSNPDKIMAQYQPDVKIGDIRHNLHIAF